MKRALATAITTIWTGGAILVLTGDPKTAGLVALAACANFIGGIVLEAS